MKKKFATTVSVLLMSKVALGMECSALMEDFTHLEDFSESITDITAEMSETKKVLNVSVTKFGSNQGTGKVSVVVDGEGNISALRIDFDLRGQKKMMIKTLEELNNGERLDYVNGNEPKAALVVKKKSDKISASGGGEFQFSILVEKPDKYKHYSLFLRKNGTEWIAKSSSGVSLKKVDLTPNAPKFQWDGTFSSATFE